MGKRFTETTKWADTWFRALPASLKLGWFYLCDNCDAAGVIDLDRDLANFQVGDTLDWDALIEAAAGRIARLKSGKLWLTRFIHYQYGHDFPKDCQTHRSILKLLDRYAESERVIQQFTKCWPTLKEKEKDKDTDKDKARKGDARGKPFTADDVPVPDGLDTPEVRAAIADWLAYKRKRGEGYKDAAFFGRKLAEFAGGTPSDFIQAVNSSIGSNYAGLFVQKGSNGTPRTETKHRHRG